MHGNMRSPNLKNGKGLTVIQLLYLICLSRAILVPIVCRFTNFGNFCTAQIWEVRSKTLSSLEIFRIQVGIKDSSQRFTATGVSWPQTIQAPVLLMALWESQHQSAIL